MNYIELLPELVEILPRGIMTNKCTGLSYLVELLFNKPTADEVPGELLIVEILYVIVLALNFFMEAIDTPKIDSASFENEKILYEKFRNAIAHQGLFRTKISDVIFKLLLCVFDEKYDVNQELIEKSFKTDTVRYLMKLYTNGFYMNIDKPNATDEVLLIDTTGTIEKLIILIKDDSTNVLKKLLLDVLTKDSTCTIIKNDKKDLKSKLFPLYTELGTQSTLGWFYDLVTLNKNKYIQLFVPKYLSFTTSTFRSMVPTIGSMVPTIFRRAAATPSGGKGQKNITRKRKIKSKRR